MTGAEIKSDIIDALFSGGFIMSNALPLMNLFNITNVNEWLHFGVLFVTAVLGVWKLIDKIKKRKTDGE